MKRTMTRAALTAALASGLLACDGGSNVDGWHIDLHGDTGPVALSDLKGSQLTLRSFGREVHLDGVGSDAGRIVLSVPVGYNGPKEDEYTPSLFNVSWDNGVYTCVNHEDSISVDFYGLEPARGVWEGQLSCKQPDDRPEDAFLVAFDGAFKQTN